jgi:hypothetical protein
MLSVANNSNKGRADDWYEHGQPRAKTWVLLPKRWAILPRVSERRLTGNRRFVPATVADKMKCLADRYVLHNQREQLVGATFLAIRLTDMRVSVASHSGTSLKSLRPESQAGVAQRLAAKDFSCFWPRGLL